MTLLLDKIDEFDEVNPLDVIKKIADSKKWASDLLSNEEIVIEVPGSWCVYKMLFVWHYDVGVLLFSCYLDIEIGDKATPELYQLLADINLKLGIGHFEYAPESSKPNYRYGALTSAGNTITSDFVEDLMMISLDECERFYPVIENFLTKNTTAKIAMQQAVMDVVGHA